MPRIVVGDRGNGGSKTMIISRAEKLVVAGVAAANLAANGEDCVVDFEGDEIHVLTGEEMNQP